MSITARPRNTWRNLIVGVPMLTMLMAADGDCSLDWLKLQSPVQAITRVMVEPDGKVVAELNLVSTEDIRNHRFVDTATNVQLRVPDGTLIELVPTEEAGHYRTDSDEHPELVWTPGERYRVTFELDDTDAAGDYAGDEFLAIVEAPSDDISFSLDHAPEFVGDTAELSWKPGSLDAMIDVYGPDGDLVFTTFDLSTPDYDGSKWASLARGGKETLPVDVFDSAGSYTIAVCVVVAKEGLDAELSSALGPGSGFMAGECFDPIEVTVSE